MNSHIYQQLLETQEWRDKRDIITRRDELQCQLCYNDKIIEGLTITIVVGTKKLDDGLTLILTIENGRTHCLEKTATPDKSLAYLVRKDAFDEEWIPHVAKIPVTAIKQLASRKRDSTLRDFKEWREVKGLHVHHTFYQYDRQPWDYPESSLITVCAACHTHIHETEAIPVLDENGSSISKPYLSACLRCGGTGYLPQYWYNEDGICFGCGGHRYNAGHH